LKTNNFSAITDGLSNTVALSEAVTIETVSSRYIKGGFAFDTAATTPLACIQKSTDRVSLDGTVTDYGRGYYCFADGRSPLSAFNTATPPNVPSCIYSVRISRTDHPGYSNAGFLTATSNHSGGVNCALGDASVRFVSDTINCGKQTYDIFAATTGYVSTTVSGAPITIKENAGNSEFGVWGALGTVNGGESTAL
jgi:hypothetical protein